MNYSTQTSPDGHGCYRATSCKSGWTTSQPSGAFSYTTQSRTPMTCYQVTGCASGYSGTQPSAYFSYSSYTNATYSGTCYKANSCASGYSTSCSDQTCSYDTHTGLTCRVCGTLVNHSTASTWILYSNRSSCTYGYTEDETCGSGNSCRCGDNYYIDGGFCKTTNCPSGYTSTYTTSAPNSSYFTYTTCGVSSTGVGSGTIYYKVTGCASGYQNAACGTGYSQTASYTHNGYTCRSCAARPKSNADCLQLDQGLPYFKSTMSGGYSCCCPTATTSDPSLCSYCY